MPLEKRIGGGARIVRPSGAAEREHALGGALGLEHAAGEARGVLVEEGEGAGGIAGAASGVGVAEEAGFFAEGGRGMRG